MKKIKTNYIPLVLIDVLFCIVHFVNTAISGGSNDLGLIPLVIGDLLFCLIYLIIHGIITYCIYRSIIYPHFVTGIVLISLTVLLFLCFFAENPLVLGTSIFLCGCYIISIITSLITMCVFKIYIKFKSSSANEQKEPKNNF